MTEKTLKHELYKHGSYLHSLKEAGSEFVNIDDEIKKLEELFQLASKTDTPPFAVGEEYTVGQSGMLFDLKANFKLEKSVETAIRNTLIAYASSSLSNKEFMQVAQDFIIWANEEPYKAGEYYANDQVIYKVIAEDKVVVFGFKTKTFYENDLRVVDLNNLSLKPATAEQIATFKRAEHFAAKGRKWSEFKKGDKVLNNNTGRIGIVESVDEDGDAVVNYISEGPLSIRDYKCTGALYLDIIQTAEELQEVGDHESNC